MVLTHVTAYAHYLLHCSQSHHPSSKCISTFLGKLGHKTRSTNIMQTKLSPWHPAQKHMDHATQWKTRENGNVDNKPSSIMCISYLQMEYTKCYAGKFQTKAPAIKYWYHHLALLQTTECPLSKHTPPDSLDQHLISLQLKSYFPAILLVYKIPLLKILLMG